MAAGGGCHLIMPRDEVALVKREGPKIGIFPFDVKGDPGIDIGKMAQDILVTSFFKRTKLPIVERHKVETLYDEQNRSNMSQRILPVDAIVQGHITAISPSTESRNWLLWQEKYKKLEVVVDIRCIDVRSGEIIFCDKGRAVISSTNNFKVLFIWPVIESDKEVSEEAIRGAIEDFLWYSVDKIAQAVKQIPDWYGEDPS